jgi:Methyltransferase domain
MFSGQAKKLSRMVAQRDEWLLLRETRIRSLEEDIRHGEEVARERIKILEAGVKKAEDTGRERIKELEALIREREERINWLERQVRRLETPRLPPSTDNFEARLKEVVSSLPGWCSESKATWMAHHILRNDYKVAAEIGVYGGRSIFPVALAIAANQGRAVFAIDAWENSVATSTLENRPDYSWWDTVDLISIKNRFLREIISQNMISLIKIIELPSSEACRAVSKRLGRSIDFLHIDGAHSEAQAVTDSTEWSELVAPGGTIVLDDIDWPGVRRADDFLASRFDRIQEAQGEGVTFAAYRVS